MAKVEKKSDREHQGVLTKERLAWARDLMGFEAEKSGRIEGSANDEREKLRKSIEAQAEIKMETYDLGESDGKNKIWNEVNSLNPEVLVGSVDATRFKMEWHKPHWYRDFAKSAAQVEKLKSLFDEPTAKWYKYLSPALAVFQKLDTYDGAEFDKKVKPEIWKLVQKHGENIIYGEKGLFNFLLAFDRVKDIYNPLELATLDDFALKDISAKKIKLTVGKGVGKEGGKNDRFAYAAIRKGATQQKVPE